MIKNKAFSRVYTQNRIKVLGSNLIHNKNLNNHFQEPNCIIKGSINKQRNKICHCNFKEVKNIYINIKQGMIKCCERYQVRIS